MRLLLCGGGTAGHISPAIAIAEEVKKRYPDTEILFVGREGGRENDGVKNAKTDLKTIKIQGLKRSLSIDNIKLIKAVIEARRNAEKIITDFKPDIILGTGGYVCWPVISAGRKMNVKTAIHESNISPGLTTKMLSGKCDVVFLGNGESKKYLSKRAKTLTVGNPIISRFAKENRNEARRRLGIKEDEIFILSFGGSIGADRLNNVVIEVMKNHSAKNTKIRHIHATGHRFFDGIKSSEFKAELNGCKIVPYIDNMPTALRAADIVICRCGAMTLAEISAIGVAAVLIPSPNVSGNHQYKNGKYLSDRGAATLIEEKNLTAECLEKALFELEIDKNGRKNRAKNIKAFSTPDSAKRIVDELILMKNHSK